MLRTGVSNREQHRDRLRREAASDERQDRNGLPVQPLHIVDQAHEGTLFRHLREQAERREANEKAFRRRPIDQAERAPQRSSLRGWQLLGSLRCPGAQQLLQAGERQLHLRLHPRRSQHRQI